MKYINLFERYRSRGISKRKSITNNSLDIEELEYIFDSLRDIGFSINIRIENNCGSGILRYCNGHIKVTMQFKYLISDFDKKEIKKKEKEINDAMAEVNDRLEASEFLFFNDVDRREDTKWDYFVDDWDNLSLMGYRNISYYLFLQSGFKRGTKFKIPDPVYF